MALPFALNFADLRKYLADYYNGCEYISVEKENPSILNPCICNNTNNAKIFVFGNDFHGQITVVLDNLGKGASGAAIQNMDL